MCAEFYTAFLTKKRIIDLHRDQPFITKLLKKIVNVKSSRKFKWKEDLIKH